MEKVIEIKYAVKDGKINISTYVSGELRKCLPSDGEAVLMGTLQENKERVVGILSVLVGVECATKQDIPHAH